jgi:hypothetical protein
MNNETICTFTSVWSDGSEITTPAIYDPDTGEVSAETSDQLPDNDATLEREYISTVCGDKEVCPTCHTFLLLPTMEEGVGKQLEEVWTCMNPDCESH